MGAHSERGVKLKGLFYFLSFYLLHYYISLSISSLLLILLHYIHLLDSGAQTAACRNAEDWHPLSRHMDPAPQGAHLKSVGYFPHREVGGYGLEGDGVAKRQRTRFAR